MDLRIRGVPLGRYEIRKWDSEEKIKELELKVELIRRMNNDAVELLKIRIEILEKFVDETLKCAPGIGEAYEEGKDRFEERQN